VFNCEARQVEKFYSVVSHLENALELDTEPEEEAVHHSCER
jgi:hypothetical protein